MFACAGSSENCRLFLSYYHLLFCFWSVFGFFFAVYFESNLIITSALQNCFTFQNGATLNKK